MDEIEQVFRPEFLNRLDDIIVFRHLTKEDLKQVIDLELAKVRERLGERGLKLVLTDDAKEFIDQEGLEPRLRCSSAPSRDREQDRRPADRRIAPRRVRRQGLDPRPHASRRQEAFAGVRAEDVRRLDRRRSP